MSAGRPFSKRAAVYATHAVGRTQVNANDIGRIGHRRLRKFDGSAKSPLSALRCISKSLRRKLVRLTPLRFARRKLNFFRNRLVFDSYRFVNFGVYLKR